MVRIPVIGPEYQNFESVTVSTSSVGLTAATALDYKYALITVESAVIRFRLDGTAPTAAIGHEASPGDVIILDSSDQVLSFRAIRRDGVDATLRVSYGR